MKFKVEKVEKYGATVACHKEMDELRREQCLCFHCGEKDECGRAKSLLKFCTHFNMAMAITRCDKYSK